MKLTRHNGRAGKNGVYNPKHNDRNFKIENAEHINPELAKQDFLWDCYQGFSTTELRDRVCFRLARCWSSAIPRPRAG